MHFDIWVQLFGVYFWFNVLYVVLVVCVFFSPYMRSTKWLIFAALTLCWLSVHAVYFYTEPFRVLISIESPA